MSAYRGRVILVVNTASFCGLTPQYRGLERLWRTYGEDGLVVLGFPCNQFGRQEPGQSAEIAHLCETKFDVTFQMFDKVCVNGPKTHPIYRWLKSRAPGFLGTQNIKWNFTKFLVSRDGLTVTRFKPSTTARSLETHIQRMLRTDSPRPVALGDPRQEPAI